MTKPRSKRVALVAASLLLAAAIGALLWVSITVVLKSEIADSKSQLSLYQSTLNAGLKRHAHLPFVLSQDPHVVATARGTPTTDLNVRLKAFAESAELEAIYLMDMTGLTIAASNFDQAQTFLGRNYGFRPYFQNAVAGAYSQFFAIGVTTLRPGYFISAPVRIDGKTVGVVAIKADLSQIGADWPDGEASILVSNPDGVIVLASNPDWRYRTLEAHSDTERARLAQARQFANEPLTPMNWTNGRLGPNIDGVSYIQTTVALDALGWTLHYLVPASNLWRKVATAMAAAGLAAIIATAIWLYIRSLRIRQALRHSQDDRRKLRAANTKLETEIAVRRQAESRLEDAQKELRRTSKLAALGQLSASVTHELGQPLSALKTHITAAELGATADTGLLKKLGGLVHRMEAITTDLRFFAKPGNDRFEILDLNQIAKDAADVVRPQIEASAIDLRVATSPTKVEVLGNKLRLEQVVVNLLSNAKTALTDADIRQIELAVGDDRSITVTDTGIGLNGQSMDDLAEPFFTTQASGDGLGLGLAISTEIIRDHHGSLHILPNSQGATFKLTLPRGDHFTEQKAS